MKNLLWLPCVIASFGCLFAPETACIMSHLVRGREVVLGKYRVRAPLNCVIGGDRNTYLWTFSAPGIARLGFKKYLSRDIPVSEMTFYPVQHPEQQLHKNVTLDGVTILVTRSIRRVSTTLRHMLTEFSEFFHVSWTGLLIHAWAGTSRGLGALRTKRSG